MFVRLILLLALVVPRLLLAVTAPRELFNGRDLSGWYTYLQGKGKDCDPDGVFRVTNGVIRISGQGFGALVSTEEFADYRLRVEYRFLGGEQFGWKKGWAPDSGILFHSTGSDGAFEGMWMEALEMNLIKGATGDFWGVGARGKSTIALSCRVGARRHEGKYAIHDPNGLDVFTITGNTRVCRFDLDPNWRDRYETSIAANENPIGEWNVAELICRGDEVTALFNGKVVNRGFGARPSKGRIQLQAEGCPLEFRRVTISPVDAEDVRWIDGRDLPLEGKAFTDVRSFYDRLPSGVTTNVNAGVRALQRCSSSMQFRFVSDSRKLRFDWRPCRDLLELDHMPATGVSGIDVYRLDPTNGWRYVKTGRITDRSGATLTIDWTPGEACLVNLPLYNGLADFRLGVDAGTGVRPLPPRRSGVDKPVVFYGTSITQGGCCSRPGTHFVNRLGRDLDVPVVGLGFSGSGFMELEMSDHLAAIDASCYVLDCIWNMCLSAEEAPLRAMERNYEPFVRNLRRLRPDVPIILAEWCDVFFDGRKDARDAFLLALYRKLIAEGWRNLHYLPKNAMFDGDGEGTVDGIHPNDLGMKTLAHAYGKAVSRALRLRPSAVPTLGYMLDVSRDKVPTMDSLRRIVDVISALGYNQFQLYTEHTFAYQGHETVWKNASPMTAEEIVALDDYCWSRGIELVPNQNSFGHMERWLRHEVYRRLAEAPDCPVNPWGGKAKWPRALCPTDPASTNFLDGLYGQLLPCFRHTKLFNVGCDEVFDLIPGVRSAAAIAARGESAVFLDHFRSLQALSGKHGKRVMYWADHLLRSPGAEGLLPKDAVALVYAYEADDKMDFLAGRAVREGVPFYVAPGTSSWCSLFGRYWNMKLNVAGAFETARRFGAEGCLLCDWGDLGHIQPFLVSLPALVYAADCAHGRPPTDAEVIEEIDRLTGARCGEALLILGDLYLRAYDSQPNTTALFRLLQEGEKYPRPWYWTNARLDAAFARGREALAKIDVSSAPPWVKTECELLALILEATELSWAKDYQSIATRIAARYRELWLRLNRPGGLEDSVQTLFERKGK